ncbi:hypothetical protein, partial [Lentilactobacillus hilgardii]|uniref:hypothetical protein n=1 Tax=Lentilactobacillus hilgardii TaxID=1588 RepID=UPI0021A440A9
LLKDGFVVNTILKEADLFCPNSVRINFTIYHIVKRSIQHIAGSNFVSIHPRSSQETGDICAFQAFHNKYTVLPMALVDSTGPHRDW